MQFNFKKIRRFCRDWHRDIGYFFSGLVIIYAISGLALNHNEEWDPDFVLNKKEITLDKVYSKEEINDSIIRHLGGLVGEKGFKLYDFPTSNQVKVYYKNATLSIRFDEKKGVYEQVSRRPLIYHVNLIHLNRIDYWRWFSDIFSLALIFLSVSGLIILKGKYGFTKRGYILFGLGLLPPLIAVALRIFL